MKPFNKFTEYAQSFMPEGSFRHVDVGCAGGVHPLWLSLGSSLRAYAFDIDLEDISFLKEQQHVGVEYIAANILEAPLFLQKRETLKRSFVGRNPWQRLSVVRALENNRKRFEEGDQRENLVELKAGSTAGDAPEDILLSQFLEKQKETYFDHIKIDVDGGDLGVLVDLEPVVDKYKVLAFDLEVNFVGGFDDTDHAFANTDMIMRQKGFELFNLHVNHYSNAALPGRFMRDVPCGNYHGKPLQADALYVKDICADYNEEFLKTLSPQQLLNCCVIFSLYRKPDWAAEILLKEKEKIGEILDADIALDLLCQDQQGLIRGKPIALSYRDYIQEFERENRYFYTDG